MLLFIAKLNEILSFFLAGFFLFLQFLAILALLPQKALQPISSLLAPFIGVIGGIALIVGIVAILLIPIFTLILRSYAYWRFRVLYSSYKDFYSTVPQKWKRILFKIIILFMILMILAILSILQIIPRETYLFSLFSFVCLSSGLYSKYTFPKIIEILSKR